MIHTRIDIENNSALDRERAREALKRAKALEGAQLAAGARWVRASDGNTRILKKSTAVKATAGPHQGRQLVSSPGDKDAARQSAAGCPPRLTALLAQRVIPSDALDSRWAAFDGKNPQHRHLLSLCCQYGWETAHEAYGRVADLQKLGHWLRSDSAPVRLPLKAMSKAQCRETLSALESMIVKKYSEPQVSAPATHRTARQRPTP